MSMARRTDAPAATVKLVRERDGHACVSCGRTRDLTTQHRRARGMGGSRWPGINLPSNLLTLCGSGTTGCHGWVEERPSQAKDLGLAVSQHHPNPGAVPVFTWRGWLLLNDDGTTEETETPWT